MVSSETFSLDEIATESPQTTEIDESSRTIVFTKNYELINPWMAIVDTEQLNESEEDSSINCDHEIINPANIGIERCFGMMKFYEDLKVWRLKH